MTDIDISKLDLSNPEIVAALKRLDDEQKFNSALRVYCDTAYDWQKQAIGMTADHRLVGLVSGNRTGKSYSAAAMATMCVTGKYPHWYTGKRFKGPITCMVACVDSNSLKRVWQKYLLGTENKRLKSTIGTGMIPKADIVMDSMVSVRGDDVVRMNVRHVSGGYSTIEFTSYSQGREAVQGFSGDLILIDEQPNVPFLQEAITRTKTTNGAVLLTFTPLEGLDYTLEQLLDLPPADKSPTDTYGAKVRTDGEWGMVRASWWDAPHACDEGKTMEETVESAKRTYGIDFACRVYGIPSVGSGNIFQFKPEDVCFNTETTLINDEWKQLIGVDFGWSTNDPSAMIKLAWDEYNDVIHVLEEWKGHTPNDQAFVKHVNYLDPNVPIAWPRDGNKASDWKGGGTISDKLRNEWGLNMLSDPFSNPEKDGRKGNNHIQPGLQEINDRLSTGRLKISGDCQELLKEMSFYHYGKDIQGNSTGKPDKNCSDHCIDALRYGVMTIIQGYGDSPKKNPNIWDKYIDDDDFEYHII